MALAKCSECNREISDQAESCPHCGFKAPKGTSRFTIFIGGLIILAIARTVWQSSTAPPPPVKSPAELAAQAKKEADFQTVVKVAAWAKKNAKNPASFELTYAGLTGTRTVCIEFRATNSFNAIVPGRYIMSDTVSGDTAALWNQHCVNQTITDYSYARQAL